MVMLVPPANGPLEGLTPVMEMISTMAVNVTGEPSRPVAEALRVLGTAVDPRVQLPTVAMPA
jgi:hypothetical protein